MDIRAYRPSDEDAVIALWRVCGLLRPWNDPHKDIARKEAVQPDLFLVGCENEVIVGAVMAGYDGHRGWAYYLAVEPSRRRLAHGRALMQRVEVLLEARGCPKINLMVRRGNEAVLRFYEKLGYADDATVLLGKRLIADVDV